MSVVSELYPVKLLLESGREWLCRQQRKARFIQEAKFVRKVELSHLLYCNHCMFAIEYESHEIVCGVSERAGADVDEEKLHFRI